MTAAQHPALPPGIHTWVTLPGAVKLLAAARGPLEAGHRGDRTRIPVTLTESDRRDAGRLLGLAWQASDRPVTLGMLRSALTRAGATLPGVLTATGGPLRDLLGERAARNEQAAAHRARTTAELASAHVPDTVIHLALQRRWLGDPTTAHANTIAIRIAAVLERVRTPGASVPLLATLAGETLSDPHALDASQPLGRATARILAATQALHDNADPAQAAELACSSSSGWRTTWANAGVACDEVSSMVLVLNVPLPRGSTAARVATPGEPVWLTARTLRDLPAHATTPGWAPPAVRVCENPSVIESAADTYGADCLPLVCTFGRPHAAAWQLLRALAAAGTHLFISADQDAAGRSITAALLDALPNSTPWLKEVPGTYEEERLRELLRDLDPTG